jgi:8-hydroxy-5-deazaflavin:NADPH oxidoreductase
MKIGVLGTGQVGKALATGFASRDHEVMIGSRNAAKGQAVARELGGGVAGGTFAEVASWCELGVLATPWSGTENAIDLAGADNLAGKVVIDVTNPLVFREGAAPELALGHTDSGGEQVQRWLPGARVVKAFNIVGNPYMVDPDLPGGPPDMFIAGDDTDAKAAVTEILESFGWPGALDLGGIEAARYLEPMAMVWIVHGFRAGSWDHAFKLLRR